MLSQLINEETIEYVRYVSVETRVCLTLLTVNHRRFSAFRCVAANIYGSNGTTEKPLSAKATS